MLDRESTFADPDTIALLTKDFVPVAVDVFYLERRQDAAGRFYRKVVAQRPGMRQGRTTQGFYIFTPDGELLVGWNNRDPQKVRRYLREALQKRRPIRATEPRGSERAGDPGGEQSAPPVDPRYARVPPKGGLVVDVFAKVLAAEHRNEADRWNRILRGSLGRDHLWLTAAEVAALVAGRWPESLTERITRFHLVDNTRGEPPMWGKDEVRAQDWQLRRAADGLRLTGTVAAATKGGERGCDLAVAGRITVADGRVTGFDLVARGRFHGAGRWTRNDTPEGEFDFAVAFRIAAADDPAAVVPPQGARYLPGYLELR